MARLLITTTAAVLLTACGAEDPGQLGVEPSAATVDPEAEDIAAETWEYYQELSGRLEERGVTIEELLAAAEDEDEEAILEMFGWTPEEMATAEARALDLIERAGFADYPADDAVPLEGWDCGWKGGGPFAECTMKWAAGLVFGAYVTAGPISLPRAAIAVLVGAGLCLCSFDSTDPGPPVRRK